MKRILFIAILAVLHLSSCNKQLEDEPCACESEYFEFGYTGGLAGVHKVFVISNGQLYPDSTSRPPMSAAKYNIAKTLIRDFPNYLWKHRNQTWGCQGCADQFTIRLRRSDAGVPYQWVMDLDRQSLPPELQAYADQVYRVASQL